jgi:predicted hotdog family 3-hydroxylacyl-ACP dehydratase
MAEHAMLLDREAIMARVPHQGSSCLLDAVCQWDQQHIVCESRSHLLASNPYRVNGRLSAVCAAEFAAQSFALHASLKAVRGTCSRGHGYLASVRNLVLLVDTLDECSGLLYIKAEELATQQNGMLYAFDMLHQDVRIASGRATVAFTRDIR